MVAKLFVTANVANAVLLDSLATSVAVQVQPGEIHDPEPAQAPGGVTAPAYELVVDHALDLLRKADDLKAWLAAKDSAEDEEDAADAMWVEMRAKLGLPDAAGEDAIPTIVENFNMRV